MKIIRRPHNRRDRPELERLWREGLTYGQIALRLGLSRGTIAGYLARRGLARGTARGGWLAKREYLAAGEKFDAETHKREVS